MLARFNRMTIAVLSGVTASLLTTSAALAQDTPVVVYGEPQENVRSERVTFADLDLAQKGDVRKLKMRVAGAVKRVCLFEYGHIGLQDNEYYTCADEAFGGAEPQIAQAVQRAQEIALTGRSSIAATAITISGATN